MSGISEPFALPITPLENATSDPKGRIQLSWCSRVTLILACVAFATLFVKGSRRLATEEDKYVWAQAHRDFRPFHSQGSLFTPFEIPTWSHGWPIEFCSRVQSVVGKDVPLRDWKYEASSPWSVTTNVYRFSLWILAVDLLIALAIISAIVAGCERWIRRRGRFRFSLFDMGVVATVVCGALGWWQWHSRQQIAESQFLGNLQSMDAVSEFGQYVGTHVLLGDRKFYVFNQANAGGQSDPQYHGPDWLIRLVGNPRFLGFCMHVDRLEINTLQMSEADCRGFAGLRYLERLEIAGRLTPALAEGLASLPNLRELGGISYFTADDPPLATSSDVHLLSRLSRLEVLDLCSSELQPADLEVLKELLNLTTLRISGRQFPISAMERLAAHPALKIVYADIAATDEEKNAIERAHPQLRIFWVDLPERK
jgi:hypothetical protein